MGFAPPLGKVVGKVPSLLFDIELVEDQEQEQDQSKPNRSTEALCQLRRCTRPRSQFIQQLDIDVRAAHEAGATEPMALADALAEKGYRMNVRRTLGSVTALRCLQNLRHTFLSCMYEGHERPVIVDPHFREQFEVAKASPEYDSIVAELPAVFVGTEDEIELLVHLLCSELQRAFKEKGVPPWRSAASMLSKWKPLNSIDIPATRYASNASSAAEQDSSLAVSGSSSTPRGITPSTVNGAFGTTRADATQIDFARPSKLASAPGADGKGDQKRVQSCSLPRVQLYGFAPQSRKVFPCET